MQILKSPITIGFLALEVFCLGHYFTPSHGEFVNKYVLQGFTGVPLAFALLVYLPVKWPDKSILFIRNEIAKAGHLFALKMLVFIGVSVYLSHLSVSIFA